MNQYSTILVKHFKLFDQIGGSNVFYLLFLVLLQEQNTSACFF